MPGSKHKKKGRVSSASNGDGGLDTSRPTAVFKPGKPRSHTLSIAIPGSIIANCQTHDLKCYLAGSIARAAAVFCVDEIVVFDDTPSSSSWSGGAKSTAFPNAYSGDTDPSHFLAHLLSYLETPPHLRRHLFPMHPDLRTAGSLPSLDLPHHLRSHEACRYREGVSVPARSPEAKLDSDGRHPDRQPAAKKAKRASSAADALTSFVEVGFPDPVVVRDALPPWTRVTVEFDDPSAAAGSAGTVDGGRDSNKRQHHSSQQQQQPSRSLTAATPVDPSAPREDGGFYWGYSVRRARSLAAVFTECAWPGGYDVSVGTSERGTPTSSLMADEPHAMRLLRSYNHLLLVFGGVAGLEAAVDADEELGRLGLRPQDTNRAFDLYVNLVPHQGSRTIRAEEAVWIGLGAFREFVERRSGRMNMA